MNNKDWTSEWPTELGWYWSYGGYKNHNHSLEPMQVIQVSNGILRVIRGAFVYPYEYDAVFMPMDLPELP